MTQYSSDIAFSQSVKAVQTRMGSRSIYRRVEENGGFAADVSAELAQFIAQIDSAFLATAGVDSRPYIQHRGGPKGFLRVLGPRLLAFADFSGNRQYITAGNLDENDQAFLFLMDYRNRRRVKLWGRAEYDETPEAIKNAAMPDYPAAVERVILFHVQAWDLNCPKHIPVKIDASEADARMADLIRRIADLEAENAELNERLLKS